MCPEILSFMMPTDCILWKKGYFCTKSEKKAQAAILSLSLSSQTEVCGKLRTPEAFNKSLFSVREANIYKLNVYQNVPQLSPVSVMLFFPLHICCIITGITNPVSVPSDSLPSWAEALAFVITLQRTYVLCSELFMATKLLINTPESCLRFSRYLWKSYDPCIIS